MKNLLFFILLFSNTLCFSQRTWISLKTSSDDIAFMSANNKNTAWIKVVSKNIEYISSSGKKQIIDGHEISLYKIDCPNRKIGFIQSTIYNKKGNAIYTVKLQDYEVEMDYVIPDSVGENYLNSFCNLPTVE
jgi:hypothetical protein